MQRIIIDTNVLVSALIQRSYPYLIVDRLFIGKEIELCISVEIFAEYYEVLNREKFARFPDFHAKAQALLVDIEVVASTFQPSVKLDLISDKDDNKFLELADACEANYLITGNTNDFTITS